MADAKILLLPFPKQNNLFKKALLRTFGGVLISWIVDPVIVNNCRAMKFFTTVILLLLFSLTAFSQQQKFKITDLEFMAGNWKTASDWGDMDEIWSSPMGNCMMCTFRCVKDGKVVFYEFIVIEQNENDSVPVLKLRHFNPGSIGWEDKDKPYLYP